MEKDLTPFLKGGESYSLANEIIQTLILHGYKSYFAGGCVRDAIIGRSYQDLDIVTEALPEKIEKLFFGRTIPVGKKFGIIIIHQMGINIEVATFRKDGNYIDGRRPDHVDYGNEIEDAKRRDFTINALFYDPIRHRIIDHVGGLEDIARKVIQTVGKPDVRFQEDYLRVLRLFRLAENLHFSIEPKTLSSAQKLFYQLDKLSSERKREELFKSFFRVKNQYQVVLNYQKYGLWKVYFNQTELFVPEVFFKLPCNDEISLLCALLWNVDDYEKVLKSLKLSSKQETFISKVLKMKSQIHKILENKEGEKRSLCLTKEFSVLMKMMSSMHPGNLELARLWSWCQVYDKNPPKPLLAGSDLVGFFQGKELGFALDLVFKEQLIQNWPKKELALSWLLKQKK